MIKAKNDQKSNDLFLIIWKKGKVAFNIKWIPSPQLVSTF